MANQSKIKRTYTLPPALIRKIERLAEQSRRDLSTIIEIAVLALPESLQEFESVALAASSEPVAEEATR